MVVPFHLRRWWTPARTIWSEPVQPVEGSYLIGFSERRIVKDHVPKVFYGSAIEEDSLADMNNFGRALPQSMHAKELARLPLKKQFEHAGFIAEHHALGKLRVLCDSHFVWNLLRGQGLLG